MKEILWIRRVGLVEFGLLWLHMEGRSVLYVGSVSVV